MPIPHAPRILLAAGTLDKAKQFRDDLHLPSHTLLVSMYHHAAGRGLRVDLLLIERSAANEKDLETLLPCTYPNGRAYFIEEIR